MLCIKQTNTEPYFNIAAEEYFLKNFEDDIFMLWRSEPSVVVGKHQNTLGEVNHLYIRENKIKVVRRLSGGGTVFHDLGNVNFTFIRSGEKAKLVDFRKFTEPVVAALNLMGVPAFHSGRNDLLINGLKISGNAEHVYKDRVLHHGTLLFSSDLSHLNEAIKVDLESYHDKSVKSFRSEVTNISKYIGRPMGVEEFLDELFQSVSLNFNASILYQPSFYDIGQINSLVESKYCTWEWNFAYSPNYVLKRRLSASGIDLAFEASVQKGFINELQINCSDEFMGSSFRELLLGKKLNYSEIEFLLNNSNPFSNHFSVAGLMRLIF